MKALVLSVVFALTSVVIAVSGNNVKDFAYNSEKQENGVETQTVYKIKEGKYLERHLQYNYTHDEKGRVSAKEILKWNYLCCNGKHLKSIPETNDEELDFHFSFKLNSCECT